MKIVEINPEVGVAVRENDGYCPCLIEQNEDTKCPCKEFRETGKCHCGRYEKVPDDLISRSALLAELSRRLSIVDMVSVAEIVESVPAVEAEPVVHAHWVSEIVKKCDWKGRKRDYYQPYSCPVCHTPDLRKGESKYCSECGAHMDEEVAHE